MPKPIPVPFGLLTLAGAPRAGVNQIQSLTITGSPTGGTFTVTVGSDVVALLGLSSGVSGAIAYNADKTAIQTVMDALLGSGNCAVNGTALPAGTITLTMVGKLAGFSWAVYTTTDSLSGGSSPASAISITTAGVAASYRGAEYGCRLADTTNQNLYINTGTQYAPVWSTYQPNLP